MKSVNDQESSKQRIFNTKLEIKEKIENVFCSLNEKIVLIQSEKYIYVMDLISNEEIAELKIPSKVY